ncbi:MAG TPA: protein kinase [Polyangiaceae bacterium]
MDVGRVVAGKYELVRLLGRGSMGEVWVAHHQTLGEQVALKVLSQAPVDEEEVEDASTAAARFLFEAQVAARLSRKTRHIVRVTDHGEEEDRAYLVMELLEGETLEGVLARDGTVPLPVVVKIITQVARALTHAHAEGVLHRDLKPANVFLSRDEDGRLLVKLLDFGIARVVHAHRAPPAFSTAKGLVFGTPSYMSPEQARASSKLDQRCDLWSLATIAYEALTGELPVKGSDTDQLLENLCAGRIVPLRQTSPDMPVALDSFFRRALAPAIGVRFESAAELAAAFARAADVEVPAESPTNPPPRPPSMPDAASSPSSSSAPVFTEVDPEVDRLRRSARTRVAAVAAGLTLVSLVGAGIVWRALSPSPGASRADAVVPPSAASNVASSPPPSPNAASAEPGAPAIAVSALPRAQAHPPTPGPRSAGEPPVVLGPSPVQANPASPAGPVVPPPAPPPAIAPSPAPSPVQSSPSPSSPTKKIDRSEVL